MAIHSKFNARNADAYDRLMGRWSRRLAAGFTAFTGLQPGERVLDAGCGTGSLLFHLEAAPERPAVTGVDASPLYVAAVQARGGTAAEGDICALPFPDATFDRTLSQLVLQFIPDTARAAAELHRVTRPGGTVAAAVWASGGGLVGQRMFLDTAAMLDPAAAALRSHSYTRPMTRPGELAALWRATGLQAVTEDSVTIWMHYQDFADYWDPLASGEGTIGLYVTQMAPDLRQTLRGHLQAAYLAGDADGPRAYAATALVCKGTRAL